MNGQWERDVDRLPVLHHPLRHDDRDHLRVTIIERHRRLRRGVDSGAI